jgi:hypothetical protein
VPKNTGLISASKLGLFDIKKEKLLIAGCSLAPTSGVAVLSQEELEPPPQATKKHVANTKIGLLNNESTPIDYLKFFIGKPAATIRPTVKDNTDFLKTYQLVDSG